MSAALLPPCSTPLERALADVMARVSDVPVPLRDLWNPHACPAALLPWLAWGVSIDFWDSAWTDAEKRTAIAGAIDAQRRKGTRASLRAVLDRFDPMIRIVEWFEDRGTLDPHTFRLELPLLQDSDTVFDETLVAALLRDIAAVKPLRSHMFAVYRIAARAAVFIAAAGAGADFLRLDGPADTAATADPAWANYLQTEQGEPIRGGENTFLEVA